jgi:hypothetical protein
MPFPYIGNRSCEITPALLTHQIFQFESIISRKLTATFLAAKLGRDYNSPFNSLEHGRNLLIVNIWVARVDKVHF